MALGRVPSRYGFGVPPICLETQKIAFLLFFAIFVYIIIRKKRQDVAYVLYLEVATF